MRQIMKETCYEINSIFKDKNMISYVQYNNENNNIEITNTTGFHLFIWSGTSWGSMTH